MKLAKRAGDMQMDANTESIPDEQFAEGMKRWAAKLLASGADDGRSAMLLGVLRNTDGVDDDQRAEIDALIVARDDRDVPKRGQILTDLLREVLIEDDLDPEAVEAWARDECGCMFLTAAGWREWASDRYGRVVYATLWVEGDGFVMTER